MTALAPVLEVADLRVAFRSGIDTIAAVDGVSLAIRAGETVGIVGESGSGKSTLARALIGLLPKGAAAITRGDIRANGVPVPQTALARLRGRVIAMVFQDPLSYLNPLMTAGRQIAESVRRHDPGAAVTARVEELLAAVKLPAAARSFYPHELSGGMRQRVLLAIALGCRPQLLVADEPTTALDATTQEEILALIREVVGSLGMALLLISHDLAVVSTMCERVHVMYRGRLVESGAAARIFAAPRHPYTRGLLNAARAARDENGRFVVIEGDAGAPVERAGCPFAIRCDDASERCRAEAPPAFSVADFADHSVHCWRVEDRVDA